MKISMSERVYADEYFSRVFLSEKSGFKGIVIRNLLDVTETGHYCFPARGKYQNTSMEEKKKFASLDAFSFESEPCTAFICTLTANSALMVPFSAFAGSVLPISFLNCSTALSCLSTITTTGPEVINSTRPSKKALSRW